METNSVPLASFLLPETYFMHCSLFSELFLFWLDISQNSVFLGPFQTSRHPFTSSHPLSRFPGPLRVGLSMCSRVCYWLQVWLLAHKLRCVRNTAFIFSKSAKIQLWFLISSDHLEIQSAILGVPGQEGPRVLGAQELWGGLSSHGQWSPLVRAACPPFMVLLPVWWLCLFVLHWEYRDSVEAGPPLHRGILSEFLHSLPK